MSDEITKSATLVMNEKVQALEAAGRPVVNLGFGEAGLPVLPVLSSLAAADLRRNEYPKVQGSLAARSAVAGYFRRHGIGADPGLCLIAPGSKAILYGLLRALDGDVVLARPSWVSYAAQASLLGRRSIWVDVPAVAGGVPDPDLLPAALDKAIAEGARPRVMILTLPDNPTGTVAPAEVVRRLCAIAEKYDLAIISDEIYRGLAYDQDAFLSPAEVAPDRTFVTAGLSKSLALGGWRIGVARFPQSELGETTYRRFVAMASEVWSGLAVFLEAVVEYVYAEPADVTERVAASRRLHQAVSTEIWRILSAGGAEVRKPAGGFYLYPSFVGTPLASSLGATTDVELAERLLDEHGIAAIPGSSFGDDPSRLALRVVTSMVYGTGDAQRLATLHAADPLAAAPVVAGLGRLRSALG